MSAMTKIDTIEPFYLRVSDFDPARDPVKDLLLIRVRAGNHEGWGECEAAPIASLAAFVMPESHATCRSIIDVVRGEPIETPADIRRITNLVAAGCANLLQTPHAFSGLEMALWDLLGKKCDEPVYRLLGDQVIHGMQPYAVVPFAATPEATFAGIRARHDRGLRAIKVGWGGFGCGNMAADRAQLEAARSALGPAGRLFLDAGCVWDSNLAAAQAYTAILNEFGVEWLEEPFHPTAVEAYRALAGACGPMKLAAGEHLHDLAYAKWFLRDTAVGVLQFDSGRAGGIAAARSMAEYTAAGGIAYVNHTYTSHLALAASLHAYAGLQQHELCEFPCDETSLGWRICASHLAIHEDGNVHLPERPGLGIEVAVDAVRDYLCEVEFRLDGRRLTSSDRSIL